MEKQTRHSMSRYPGIRAFEKSEYKVFFGRQKEAKKLFSLVKAKPLVVLFSKSGIGKSSLINAGLSPLLEADSYATVNIRLQNTGLNPIETVKNELKPFLNESLLQEQAPDSVGLWEYLRACEFKQNGESRVPVLVFDQFEEFFEHKREVQDQLTHELSDLVSERLPERIRESLRKIPFRSRSKEQLAWHSPIPVKIIMAIRSDRISLLDEMSTKINSMLHNRFHLKPLDESSAREAIEAPASMPGDHFVTPAFTYAPEALLTILDFLKNKEGEIESFQLQLLCQKIEKTMRRKNTTPLVVENSDFGGSKGINSILNNYYLEEIEELSSEEQNLARKFIEEGLIVGGRRVGVSEGVEEQSFGITPELLRKLLESRLIRAENTHLGRSFELSHDTLVAPILEAYDIRREAEERAAAQKREQEQELLLAAERKKRNQARLLAAVGFLLFFLALFGGYFAFQQSKVAQKARNEAERALDTAKRARDRAQRALDDLQATQLQMIENYLISGRDKMDLSKNEAAIEDFDVVLALREALGDTVATELFVTADSLKKVAIERGDIQGQYNKLMEEGERSMQNGQYYEALRRFREARELSKNIPANRQRARLRAEAAELQLLPELKDLIKQASRFEAADACEFAKTPLRKAERIARVLNKSEIRRELEEITRLKAACR